MRLESIRRLRCARLFAWALCYTLIFTGSGPAWAGVCSTADLADVPLELMNGSVKVPSILMISLDNSDTMDYDVMTNANTATNGFTIGGTEYDYVFTGANATGGTAIEGVAAVRNAWQSQCHLYNKMFFNPSVTYTPWPTVAGMGFTETDSNVNTPKWDPRNGGSGSYDLTQPWGGTGATIQYTTTGTADPTVIINLSNFNPGSGTWVSGTYTYPQDPSYNAGYYTTGTYAAGSTAIDFTFTASNQVTSGINSSVDYDVYARWPPSGCGAAVTYQIANAGTVLFIGSINQSTPTNGSWVQLNPATTPYKFTSGTATASVSQTYPVAKNKSFTFGCSATNPMYAAQVKFVPRGPSYTLTRRHFYMVSTDAGTSGVPYLIDINDANTAHFFKLVDANTNGIGDPGEYQMVTYAELPSNVKALIPAPAANAYSTLLQSYANWVTYGRKRISAAINAVAMLVTGSSFTNMLVGMLTSPPSSQTGKIGPVWIKTTFNSIYYDMTANFLTSLYTLPDPHSNRGFSEDITDLGDYIKKNGGTIANNNDKVYITTPGYASKTTYPYFLEKYGGSCQAAYALMITDGASPSTASIKNYDGGAIIGCGPYNCGIFGDSFEKTAADGAMQFYAADLNASLSNNVPTNYIDKNSMQHMVTYALTFGASGPLYKANPTFNALVCSNSGEYLHGGRYMPDMDEPRKRRQRSG